MVKDCLRFVYDSFEVISQSASHIYHSALPLAPLAIRELYGQCIGIPQLKFVTGAARPRPDSITAGVNHAVWSPDGQLVAVGWVNRVELFDSTTLERTITLDHPCIPYSLGVPHSIAFSSDGCMLARAYPR